MYNFRSEPINNPIGLKGKGQVGLYVNDELRYYFYQTNVGGVQPVPTDRWVVESLELGTDITIPVYSAMKGIDLTDQVNVDWVSVRSAIEQLSLSALMHLTQEWHDSGLARSYFQTRLPYKLYGKLECGIWRGFNRAQYVNLGAFTGDCFDVSPDKSTQITHTELVTFYHDGIQIPGVSDFMVVQGPDFKGQLSVTNNVVIVKQTNEVGVQTTIQDKAQ